MYQTTLKHFENKLKEKFLDDDLTVLLFTKANAPVQIRCNKCNHIYSYNRGTTLYSSKRTYFCKLCNTVSIKKMQESCELHNLTILNYGTKVTDECTIQCNNCGLIFSRTPSTWIKHDCPSCGVNKKIINKEIYQTKLDSIFGTKELIILDEIPKSHQMTVQHKCGFIRTTSFKALLQNKACPICDKTASLGERKILSYLEKHKIDYIYQKKIALTQMRFDFYLEQYNLAIEFNGKQHYEPIEIFGGNTRFQQQQQYDQAKIDYCKLNNIKLLIIKYTDLDRIDQILATKLMEGGGIDE